jgi:hypothetical protein
MIKVAIAGIIIEKNTAGPRKEAPVEGLGPVVPCVGVGRGAKVGGLGRSSTHVSVQLMIFDRTQLPTLQSTKML